MPSTTAATKSTRRSTALPKVPFGLDETPDESKHQRAEAYALGTACTLAGREMSSIPFFGGPHRLAHRRGGEARAARIRACAWSRRWWPSIAPARMRAEKTAAVQKLRAVTAMFEAARAGASTTPEWGAAEAYAFLGRALFDQRDVVGAREALERALLIAPDYAFAKRLMSQITR